MPTTRKPIKKVLEEIDEPIDSLNYGEEEEDEEEEEEPRPRRRSNSNGRSVPAANNRPQPKSKQKPRTTKSRPQHVDLPWNNLVVSGNLGQDPEMQVTSGGTPYMRLNLAVYGGKNKDGERNPPVWLNVTIWGDLAEQYEPDLFKGEYVKCYGQLTGYKGQDRYFIGMRADYLEIGWQD